MDKSMEAVAPLGGLRAISRYQWLVFFVVWAGWTLDAADFGLFSLVLRPAMIELLGGNPPLTEIGKYGGLPASSAGRWAAFCLESLPITSAECEPSPTVS